MGKENQMKSVVCRGCESTWTNAEVIAALFSPMARLVPQDGKPHCPGCGDIVTPISSVEETS